MYFSLKSKRLEFSEQLVLILSDFNIHVCALHTPPSSDFLDFVESFNLQQSVKNPTQWKGHMLDLLLSSGLWNVELVDVCISDHNAVILKAPLPSSSPLKPHPITLSHIFTADFASKFG